MKYIDINMGEITEKQYLHASPHYETANVRYCYGAKPLKDIEILELKQKLAESDYKAIKFAEGWLTEEEYAPIKAERESLREQIRQLENE